MMFLFDDENRCGQHDSQFGYDTPKYFAQHLFKYFNRAFIKDFLICVIWKRHLSWRAA